MKPAGGHETISEHLTPRNNPEDGRIQLNCGESLRFRKDLSYAVHRNITLLRNVLFTSLDGVSNFFTYGITCYKNS
jgi:hypothetical protein